MDDDRFATDLPAWVNRFSSLINFQKLKTIFRGLSENHRELVLTLLNHGCFQATPRVFRNVFDSKTEIVGSLAKIVELRIRRVNTIENVAQDSLMVKKQTYLWNRFSC